MTNIDDIGNTRDKLLVANLTDSTDRLRYTYKTQEKAASRFERYESRRKWALIIFTVLAAGSFITSLFALAGYEVVGTLVVGLFATLATLASFLGDYLDYARRQREHHVAGVNARSLFIRYETLLSDYLSRAVTSSDARRRRDELQDSTDQLLREVPRTTRSDYKEADKSLGTDERTSIALEEALKALTSTQAPRKGAEAEG